MNTLTRILGGLTVCATLGLGTAHAADPAPLDLSDPYDIEMLIFERPDDASGERWPEAPGEPDMSNALAPLRVSLNGPAMPAVDTERALSATARSLSRRGMRVVVHELWRQDVQDRDSRTWLAIEAPMLRGLVRISKGRYLHLDTDLLLEQSDSAQTYRIQLHRRMRSDETHYIDHPRLGILITARRFETLDPELPEDAPVDEPPDVETPESKPAPGNSLPRAMPDPT